MRDFETDPWLQARALGDQLVLGLIPDSEILRCKGPPVMNEEERKTMVESVKWVGEVITGGHLKYGMCANLRLPSILSDMTPLS